MSRKLLLICEFLLLTAVVGGCQPAKPQGSNVVLVMVEGLGFHDELCNEHRDLDSLAAIKSICPELIRFTRAYTPSTLSQSAIASIMTGARPSQHGVLHNGANGVSASYQTLAEKALGFGMRSGFFSGGVPILNKFGVGQGFEIFDERKQKDFRGGFRPVSETLQRAVDWLDDEVGADAFFMGIYLPDLLYHRQPTTTDLGDERSRIAGSQQLELYESLNQFIVQLKQRNHWQQTHLVVVGVSGEIGIGSGGLGDVTGQKTQVAFSYRQSQLSQQAIAARGRQFDQMVSLEFLYPLVAKMFARTQILPLIEDHFAHDNVLTIRSDMAVWRSLSSFPTLGYRYKKYFFMFTPELKVFDSYSDRAEKSPLIASEALSISRQHKIADKLNQIGTDPCFIEQLRADFGRPLSHPQCASLATRTSPNQAELEQFLHWRWLHIDSDREFSESLARDLSMGKFKHSPLVIDWLSYQYIRKGQWDKMAPLVAHSSDKALELVTALNLQKNPPPAEGCLRYFINIEFDFSNFYGQCDDSSLLKIIEGLAKLRRKQKPDRNFWSEIANLRQSRRAKMRNFEMLLINDVTQPLDFSLRLSELYFYLPANRKYLSLIDLDKS